MMKLGDKDVVELTSVKTEAVYTSSRDVGGGLGVLAAKKGGGILFEGLTFYVVMICLFTAIGGFLFGYDTGVISGAKNFDSFNIFFNYPSDVLVSFVVSAVIVGAIFGALAGGPLADRCGRKPALIFCGSVFTVGAALMGGARDIWMLVAGRFVAGVAIGVGSLVVPMYAAEMAPPRYRGALVSLNQLFITIGILVAYGVNLGFQHKDNGWTYSLGISGAPAVVLLFGMLLLPETPYWFIMKKEEDKAKAVLEDLRGTKDVDMELDEIKQSLALASEESKSHWRELLQRKILKVLMVGVGLTIFQQLVGINAVIYYAPELFKAVGAGDSGDLLATLIIGIVNVVVTVVGLLLVDKAGRKTLLLIGSAMMFVAMTVVTVCAGLNLFAKYHSLGYITIVAICIFIAGFAVSWGAIAWIIPSETFPTRLRGKMMTISTMGNWLANFLVSMTFLPLYDAIGWGTFLVFAVIEVLSFVFVLFCVPETKGRSLEELTAGL